MKELEFTNIEWTHLTWNVAVGCHKVDADCLNCYMHRDSMAGTRYDPKTVRKTTGVFHKPIGIRDKGLLIFTSSLTDFFIEQIDEYRDEVWDIIRRCPNLTFQILTKRPERILSNLPEDWGDGWRNVWLGTSIGSVAGFWKRYHELMRVPARCKFVSFEPLYERMPFSEMVDISEAVECDWAIIGGESGAVWNGKGKKPKYPARECKLEWIEELKQDLHSFGIPTFIKQVGSVTARKMGMKDTHGRNMNEFPDSLKCREFPHVEGIIPFLKPC